MGSADAGTLHTVSICSRAAVTAADSKDSASFFTDHMLAPHAQAEALSGYCQSSVLWLFDESGQPHRFTTMPPCYELTTLLMRTLTYALGRSGSAPRDVGVQPSHSSLLCCAAPSRAALFRSVPAHR